MKSKIPKTRSRSTSISAIKKEKAKNPPKGRKPKDIEHYRHSVPMAINARVGKGAYKNITNDFGEHGWSKWFNDSYDSLKAIIEAGEIPSIERVDPKKNYCYENCIWLPLTMNQMLGKIHYYEEMANRHRKYCLKNIEKIPYELRNYYILSYGLEK
jgi:hypothetical protein